ncbi:BrnT family toxin [Devosia sp.]|uniref:BrnT family toxin n=1 Tax=Devosia sp. TaxID=1871048 RepID=UPI003267965B
MDFADVEFFEFDTADTVADQRMEYGEVRQVSTGYLHGRLCVLCWTKRDAHTVRVISLRKANDREQKKYTDATGN